MIPTYYRVEYIPNPAPVGPQGAILPAFQLARAFTQRVNAERWQRKLHEQGFISRVVRSEKGA